MSEPLTQAETQPLITAENLTKTFDSGSSTTIAVSSTDLEIHDGEFVCVVGPSGCGKTTLLSLIAGFEKPSEGELKLNGKTISGPGPDRGVVFQQPTLYPWLSVAKNVGYGLKATGVPAQEREKRVQDALVQVGLEGFGDSRVYELSGGMQQRTQIARVLVTEPGIILMDEPFSALDPFTREKLQYELLQLWSAAKKTVFFITHSVEEALYLGTRVIVMSARPGRVIKDLPVTLEASGDESAAPGVRSPDIKATPQFQDLKLELTRAIVDAHD